MYVELCTSVYWQNIQNSSYVCVEHEHLYVLTSLSWTCIRQTQNIVRNDEYQLNLELFFWLFFSHSDYWNSFEVVDKFAIHFRNCEKYTIFRLILRAIETRTGTVSNSQYWKLVLENMMWNSAKTNENTLFYNIESQSRKAFFFWKNIIYLVWPWFQIIKNNFTIGYNLKC